MTDDMLRRLPRRHGWPMVGKAVLLREIGRGAMGAVFAGWHTELDSPCAIKFLLHPDTATPERLARFQREARICAELDDPALVHVLEFGKEAGLPYLVMEWIAGRGLDQVTQTAGPFHETEGLTVLRDVGQALIGLHRRGVVHRDIKPSNLLLRAADGRIKIADLGIAKQIGSADGLQTQVILGTPAFMSPEQIKDPTAVGPTSDLFSLGATVFTLLTGRLAFTGATAWDTMQNLCNRPLPHPAEFGVSLSDSTWQVLLRLTEKDPAQRLASAERLLECLPGVSFPFRPEVLQAARPAFEIHRPEPSGAGGEVIAPPPEPDLAVGTSPLTATTTLLPEFVAPADRVLVRKRGAVLFCQCLQNDFLAPPPQGAGADWTPPNKLHVGREEAVRLVGDNPHSGPLVRAVSACARAENVRIVHIRDWHDPLDPRQRPEMEFFGEHCLMGTWGARFIDAIEAYSRDRRRAAVVDAGGINDLHDTPILGMLDTLARPLAGGDADWRATVPVGVIGVWTNVKIHYLLYDLKTRAGLHNLATCSRLVASPDRAAHDQTLHHLAAVLNVKVFDAVDDFLAFLGVIPTT